MNEDVFDEEKQLRQKYFNLLQRLQTKGGSKVEKELDEKKGLILTKFKANFRNIQIAKKQDKNLLPKLPIDGDVKKGSENFLRYCSTCHAVNYKNHNENITGPFLGNIYGRIVGSQTGYNYSSDADRRFFRWNRNTLHNFILSPGEYMPEGKCKIPVDARKPSISADIIEFLKKMSVEIEKNIVLRQQQKIDIRNDN